MTAPHDIDPQAFLSELLTQASPDLMRQMLTTFIGALLFDEADSRSIHSQVVGARLRSHTRRELSHRGPCAASAQGSTPTDRTTITRAAHSIAAASVQYVLREDSVDPVLLWSVTGPHRFGGLELMRSGFGIENPDNVYRTATVHGEHSYEFRGRRGAGPDAEIHFELRDALPGTTVMDAEGGIQLATPATDDLAVGADGSFTITVDSTPAAGRGGLVLVRDLLGTWAGELSSRLETVPPDAPTRPHAPRMDELAERAAQILRAIGRFRLGHWKTWRIGARERNVVSACGRRMPVAGHRGHAAFRRARRPPRTRGAWSAARSRGPGRGRSPHRRCRG